MEDWEDESPNEEDDQTEIENELYSMFYYHSMTEGIPEDISKKYNVDVDDYVTISLKAGESTGEEVLLKDNVVENVPTSSDRYIDRCKGSYDVLKKCSEPVSVKPLVKTSDKLVEEVSLKNEVVSIENKSPSDKLKLIHPTPSKIHYFHASRYFSQENGIGKNKPYNKYNDAVGSFKQFKGSKHFPTRDSHNSSIRMISSTPKINKKAKQTKTNRKVVLNSKQELVIIKDNLVTVDLTKEKKISCSSSNDSDPVITISSESDDSEFETNHQEEKSIDSDSDYDSDDSTVMTLDSILLNTSMPVDLNECDISVINVDYDWRKTSSPESWTRSMRKFYNKPSEKLLNFDYRSILREIRGQGSCDWSINTADMHRFKGSRRTRCLRCREEGHLKANCTKSFGCHICGTPGHVSKTCPQKMCLKCGSQCKELFPSGCGNCQNKGKVICNVCGKQGHISNFCTEAWRAHALIDLRQVNQPRSGPKYCCNCAKSGHYFEDCSKKMPRVSDNNWKFIQPPRKRKHSSLVDKKMNKRIAMLRRKSNKKRKFKHFSTTI